MNRTTSLKSNPSLPENVKILYHGTRGEAGQHIAEGGWLEPGHTQREKYERLDTNLKPLEGRVYVARDPRLVLEYALSQFGRAAGGWIFEVSADGTGTDVLIDEDDLAEMVLDGRAPENLRNFAKRIASERLWFEAENRERPALAKLGKMMIARGVLKSGRDRSRIMEKATHFAVARPMRVLRAWKLTSDFSAKDPNVSPLRWSGMVEVPVGHKAMKNPARKNATTNKATFTGWTCVSGPAELVDYLVDHGTQVTYAEFSRNVDVKSVGIKGLRTDPTVTFLRTSLPSGGEAWVLQWSGIEHLFATGAVDLDEERDRAIVLALNPHEMPIVWEEDEAMVQALGGREAMDQTYEVMVATHDHFDHEANRWMNRTMGWLVPQGNIDGTGLTLHHRDPRDWTKPVRRNPAPGPDENLLLPANQLQGLGKEKTTRIGSDVLLHKDQYGSYRFVLLGENGEPVAALQVVRPESGKSFIANVYTRPEHRRKGHASRLLAVARKRLGKVEHAKHLSEDGAAWAAARNPVASAVGKLGPGDRLSDLMGDELVYAYRWVPDYAEDTIRPGDYVLLDPEEGRGYGGPRGKRLTVRVSSKLLEYRQGDEYLYRGEAPKRANVSRDVRRPELVTLYHGTSSEYAEDIRVRGLVAVDDGQQPVVYLAVDQQEAASWAAMRVDNMAWRKVPHGHPIVVKVRVPKKNLKPGATDAHYKHVGDIAPDQIVGVYTVAENPARKTPTSPVVLYHGTPKGFDELTLKSGGVLWLTDNRPAAEQYVSGHAYAEQSGFLWTVTLKPGARIVNLSDLSIPVVREIYEGVSDARRSTFGPIAPDQWSSFADFGLLEAKPWIVSRLKAARYDAVIVKDALQSTGIPHRSFALLRLSAVQSASREPIAIDLRESIGSIEERIAGGVKNNPACKRKTDDARFGDVHVVDYFRAGSPKAVEALGGDFADVDCVRCGSKISHVFMTESGPMGGDCLATLTGDDSTRKAIRATIEKLKWSKLSVDHYGGRLQKVVLEQREAGHLRGECVISTVAYFFDSGKTSERYAHSAKGSVGLTAAVVGWAEENQLPVEARGPVQGMEQAR